jgi:hypothetical protein
MNCRSNTQEDNVEIKTKPFSEVKVGDAVLMSLESLFTSGDDVQADVGLYGRGRVKELEPDGTIQVKWDAAIREQFYLEDDAPYILADEPDDLQGEQDLTVTVTRMGGKLRADGLGVCEEGLRRAIRRHEEKHAKPEPEEPEPEPTVWTDANGEPLVEGMKYRLAGGALVEYGHPSFGAWRFGRDEWAGAVPEWLTWEEGDRIKHPSGVVMEVHRVWREETDAHDSLARGSRYWVSNAPLAATGGLTLLANAEAVRCEKIDA